MKKDNWIMIVFVLTFILSFLFSTISNLLSNINIIVMLIILLLTIFIGILFDMIGVAVTSSDEEPLHAMSSKKIKGAKTAVNFKKNAAKVSSFCNDVIGDICGVISGSTAVTISLLINKATNINILFITLIVTATISAITIGGKAIGKSFAINKCDIILYEFSKFVSNFYKVK